jgi:hypothetical protein
MTLSSVRPTVTESGHLGPNSAFIWPVSAGVGRETGEGRSEVGGRSSGASDGGGAVSHPTAILGTMAETPDRYLAGVWGTRLRHAALAVLIRARGTPLSVADIWSSVKRDHIVQVGLTAKDLADALRHECRRGRARRVSHGHYVVGDIAARTRRRILAHEREIRPGDGITMVHVMTRMRDHGSR